MASSGTIPTCEYPVTQPGIEHGSPWWEASRLTAQPPWTLREQLYLPRCRRLNTLRLRRLESHQLDHLACRLRGEVRPRAPALRSLNIPCVLLMSALLYQLPRLRVLVAQWLSGLALFCRTHGRSRKRQSKDLPTPLQYDFLTIAAARKILRSFAGVLAAEACIMSSRPTTKLVMRRLNTRPLINPHNKMPIRVRSPERAAHIRGPSHLIHLPGNSAFRKVRTSVGDDMVPRFAESGSTHALATSGLRRETRSSWLTGVFVLTGAALSHPQGSRGSARKPTNPTGPLSLPTTREGQAGGVCARASPRIILHLTQRASIPKAYEVLPSYSGRHSKPIVMSISAGVTCRKTSAAALYRLHIGVAYGNYANELTRRQLRVRLSPFSTPLCGSPALTLVLCCQFSLAAAFRFRRLNSLHPPGNETEHLQNVSNIEHRKAMSGVFCHRDIGPRRCWRWVCPAVANLLLNQPTISISGQVTIASVMNIDYQGLSVPLQHSVTSSQCPRAACCAEHQGARGVGKPGRETLMEERAQVESEGKFEFVHHFPDNVLSAQKFRNIVQPLPAAILEANLQLCHSSAGGSLGNLPRSSWTVFFTHVEGRGSP
ncbi:hypothetical protein PR048_025375 [Dryococelus australis]|uniref:Uncharacterized protein n=1 Tax=Dryococelus australis TaxID=614101 RepID=A0ABQ9GR81_9NEOP|nr:hypothetical protein PR048_025375 [Dryococelus australis]